MEGIIFSMPTMTICVLGQAADNLALPSFSVTAIAPTSAIIKLAPVTPISACTYFSLKFFLATRVNCSGVKLISVPNFSLNNLATSSLLLCIAGVTI